jgi:hypothetical protein
LDKPPWLTAVLVLFGTSGPVTILFRSIMKFWRRWTKQNLAPRSEDEAQLDPGRTSSGLLEDGTDRQGGNP